jgi:hypothetical protein
MSRQSNDTAGWKRTRRNVLGIAGILASATFSRLGIKSAHASPVSVGCFLRGTRILTPQGEQRIENLQIGDSVVTLDGKAKPIEWIGRRLYRRTTNRGWVEAIKPVRIASGALGSGVPHRELLVSQEHGLLIDGVLMRAVDLVDGSSITLHSAADHSEIEYLHIKLALHDVIFAEGALSETLFLPADHIERFDNFVEYERLYGSMGRIADVRCAPKAGGGGRERLRSRMRSAVSPWLDRRNAIDKARDRFEERAATQT